MSTKDAGAEETRLEIDFAAFEREIEKEIDELLVPLVRSPEEMQPPVVPPDAGDKEQAPASAPIEVQEAIIIESSAPKETEPQVVALEKEEVRIVEPASAASARESELHSLLDSFNVAYLSLDWDFTVENISTLDGALARIEPYCKDRREALSTYKILKMVLQRLKSRPDSASTTLNEIIRTGQDLLKRILVLEGEAGGAEREELRSLIRLVESLKKPAAAEVAKTPEPLKEAPQPEKISEPTIEPAARELSAEEMQTVSSLKEWMSHYRHEFSEVLDGMQEENGKLFQLEGVLNKKPALAPLTERLAKIRSALDVHISSFIANEKAWFDKLDYLCLPEGITNKLEEVAAISVSSEDAGASPVVEIGEEESIILEELAPEAEPESQQEQVCVLFSASGKRFGLLALHVVRTKAVSSSKIRKILKRGYATLSDFKPLFRDLRTGVSGALSGIPASELKKYRFSPLPLDQMDAFSIASSCESVILVSNGRQHGMILSEEEPVGPRVENILRTRDREGVWGMIREEGNQSIEILDIESILQNACTEQV